MLEDLKQLSFFSNPETAQKLFLEIAGDDPFAEEKLLEAFPLLLAEFQESPDPDMALSNLRHFSHVIISRMAFLGSLKQNPVATQMMITLFGHSQFLSDALIRNPEYFDWFIDSSILVDTKTREEMLEELQNMVGLFTTRESKLNAMRRFKRREILRIGLRDLMKTADLESNTRELAYLGDVSLELAQQVCYEELKKKFGEPVEESNPDQIATFATIGMGKLGGNELNYSSDIDVMFLYSDEGKTDGSVSISNHEFFTKLAQEIIHAIGGMTKEGYIFRIDARLRPDGDAGPLVRSLASYENYYASFGETWERLALIKSRPCAGDSTLGKDFSEMIRPFIYHKLTGLGEVEDLHRMKKRIDAQIAKKGTTFRNVKLGYGGIREIEFSVQMLQLLYGGKNNSLRGLGTLSCLRELKKLNFIQEEEASFLSEAYTFLRNVEHKLQIMHEQQLHTFPEDPDQLATFASRMGFVTTEEETSDKSFLKFYKTLTDKVHQLYTQFFKLPESSSSDQEIDLDWIFEKKVDTEKLEELLKPIGFLDPKKAHQNIILLEKGPSYMHVPVRTQKLFASLLPPILEASKVTADPDQALNNFERFVLNQPGSRGAFFEILLQKPKIIELLLVLFGSSQFLSDLLMANPDLFASITLPGEMEQQKDRSTLLKQVQELLSSEEEKENKILLLKRFKNEEMVRISLRDLLGLISLTDFFQEYADLANVVLETALSLSSKNEANDLAIVGFGKFGGAELSYSSDLDIIFISQNGDYADNQVAAEVMRIMSHKSDGSEFYKMDARLRPDGDKGPLAPSIEAYKKYYKQHSATWEKQSLTRAQFICGNQDLGQQFEQLRQQTIFTSALSESEKNEIIKMRDRIEKERGNIRAGEKEIKLGAGGIVDIEFIVQYFQLKHGFENKQIQTASTLNGLDALHQLNYLSKEIYTDLKTGYLFLRNLENKLRIVNNRPLDKLPKNPDDLTHCAKRMGFHDEAKGSASEQLMTILDQHTSKIRQIYLEIFKA